jgi:hypothetical protein
LIIAMAADSSTVSFLLPPGAAGPVIITGLTVPYLASALTLTATTQINGTNTSALTGTDDISTAPSVPVPTASGQSNSFIDVGSWAGDCGGVPCQWYKIDLAAAADIDFTSSWDNTADLGIYVVESDGSTLVDACDAHGNGATAQPEACTISFAAAGTYYIQMQNFAPFYPDPDPAWFIITMSLP